MMVIIAKVIGCPSLEVLRYQHQRSWKLDIFEVIAGLVALRNN